MKKDHWNRRVVDFIKPHLEGTQSSVQVATGFFTIQGYDLIREVLSGKWVQLMVGFDEHSKDRLSELLIADIMRHLSRWEAEDRRAAVIDLVERIQKGRFQIVEHQIIPDEENTDYIEARARKKDHAKVYIFDKKRVLSGSANLTKSGLTTNTENLTAVLEPERVLYYLSQFEKFWNAKDTVDLTQKLLEALLAWLDLNYPFDIYLKTIDALIQDEEVEPPRDTYKMPVKYQLVVIERLLRQLKEYYGAMLVASTGLGKTIMATHTALRLNKEKQIDNIIVFAPLQVQPDWKRAFKSAGLSAEIFTRNLLDRPGSRKGKKTLEMEEALEMVDDKYLIIIDESQYFRNKRRAKDGFNRHSFNRLEPIIKNKKSFILLLTATPYSKEIDDLNNQLHLLPHTAEKKYVKSDGQFVMEGMMDDAIAPESWKVIETPDFFEDFMKLPVVTVISTSQVAKDFAEHTEEGDYVLFGEEKRWVPKIEITKVKVPPFMEESMSIAIQKKAFLHKPKKFKNRKQQWMYSRVTVQNNAEVSWMSTPMALEDVISKSMNNYYKVQFLIDDSNQSKYLKPILDNIQKYNMEEDPKFQALVYYLKQFHEEKRKVIIFTERQLSAVYLEKSLKARLSLLKVASTVKETEDGCELKDFETEVLPIIKGFAPVANEDKIFPRERSKLVEYNVLILTDAYSTGVNLQDASVVINYDLAWTPDVLIQRAGRILRFWKTPRRVHFLVFVGDFNTDQKGKQYTHKVEERLRKLSRRGKHAQKFSEIPIIPDSDKTKYESLGVLSKVKIEQLGLTDVSQLEEFSGVSPFLNHITVLKENEERVKNLPDDISSAMTYKGTQSLIYLLLRNDKTYFRVIYDVKKKSIESIKEDALLDLIRCTPKTPVANVGADEVERLAQQGRKMWEMQHPDIDSEKLERICALYLIPKKLESGFSEMIKGQL